MASSSSRSSQTDLKSRKGFRNPDRQPRIRSIRPANGGSQSQEPEPQPEPRRGIAAVARLLRPGHWIKNLFVLAPLLFSGKAMTGAAVDALITFVAFCLASSFAYAINDVFDADDDRRHPDKRTRPVASGALSPRAAMAIAAIAGTAALVLALGAGWTVVAWVGAYIALNVAYSRWIKHVVLLDLFAIAAFFLMRLLAGSAAIDVAPTIWLLLCGGLLALYLAVSKRRQELGAVPEAEDRRAVLAEYSPALLDQIAVVLMAATFLSYCEYALLSDTAKHVGSSSLAYGAPFVLYGLLRYEFLVHRRGQGNPMETLFTDRSLLVNLCLWAGFNGWALYHR
jgi:4-hydroxybenzoate polyprenyltransferase